MDEQATTEGASPAAAVRRRPRARLLVGAALTAAALAALVPLTAGPASPPSAAGPGTVMTPLAPAPLATAPAPTPLATAETPPTATVSTPGPEGSHPLHITYPVIGMDQAVVPLTPQGQGTQATIVPPQTTDAYWLTPYGSPGSTDTTYIIGHSWEGRDTAFNHLSSQAKPGDQLTVTTAAGPGTYTVITVSTENKNTLKNSPIWDRVPNRLILVSCYTADLQGTNVVVTADLKPGQ